MDSGLRRTVRRFRRDRGSRSERDEVARASSLPDLNRVAHPADPRKAYSFLREGSSYDSRSGSRSRYSRRSTSRSRSSCSRRSRSRSRSDHSRHSRSSDRQSGSRQSSGLDSGAGSPQARSRSSDGNDDGSSNHDTVSDSQATEQPGRVREAFGRIWAEYRERLSQVYRWSAHHPLRKDIVKMLEDQESGGPSGDKGRGEGTKASRKAFEKRPHALGVTAGKHKWLHRRKRHYGTANAFWSRSLYHLVLATVRSGRDSRQRAGQYADAARLEELEGMIMEAKDIRKQRLAHVINADEQHAKIVELWQKVDWRIQGQVLNFLTDVILPEIMARGTREDDKSDGENEDPKTDEKQPPPTEGQSVRRLGRAEARKLWTKAQMQSFAKTGACFDLDAEQWAAHEHIVILEESSGSSSTDSSRTTSSGFRRSGR